MPTKTNKMGIKTTNINEHEMGLHGHDYVTDGSLSAKKFIALQALDDVTVTYTVDCANSVSLTHSSKSLPAGAIVVGDLSAVTVASGTVIGYYQQGEATAPV